MADRTCRTLCVLIAIASSVVVGCNAGPTKPLMELPVHELVVAEPPGPVEEVRVVKPPADVPRDWLAHGYRPWRHIVIHHSATGAGNAAEFDRMHRARGWDELGYHFVIDNGRGGLDGKIEVGSRWTKQKWGAHCGGTPGNEYNLYGIGICLVGNFTDRMPSEKQLASLRRLLRHLLAKYDIPAGSVIGHRDAPNAATECPGKRFHAYLKKSLLAELAKPDPVEKR